MKLSRARAFLLATVMGGVLLPGCTWLNEVNQWPPADKPARVHEDGKATAPQTKLMQTPDATWLVPADPKQEPVEHMVPKNGQPAGALNRINELEEEVASLRSEMGKMMPAVTKLAETQSALRDAVAERAAEAAAVAPSAGPVNGFVPYEPVPLYRPQEAALADPDAAYVPPAAQAQPAAMSQAAMALPAEQAVAAATPAAVSGHAPVAGIRFTDHAEKTRVVLDLNAATEYSYSLDPAANVLTVRLPRAGWAPATAGSAATRLAGSYNAAPDGAGGTILAVKLAAPAKVGMAQSLPAGGGKPHRIIIDLSPL